MPNNLVLPVDGQTAWGDEVNAALNQADNDALAAQTSIANHAANSPADPHGDRAYTNTQISTITSGVNQPNGYVKLNNSGRIIASQITGSGGPGGMYTGIFDAIATYGMTAGGSDSSGACQAACNAASSAGGGIVWIGPGTFSFSNFVFIPTNVWILMSEGTVINRIAGGTTPKYMFTNVKFDGTTSPSQNVKITGGKIDSVGSGLTSQCTPIFIIQSGRTHIENTRVIVPYNNVAIELNGCTNASVANNFFGGTNKVTFSNFNTPAVRINISNTGTTPTGLLNTLYNQSTCNNIQIIGNSVDNPVGQSGPYGSLVASDLVSTNQISNQQFHNNITITGNQMTYNASTTGNTIISNGTW